MSEFNPSPRDPITIGGRAYSVMPHPSVPSFAFGQEGRKGFVYQLSNGGDGALYALKKFKQAYRVPELVEICESLARFATWPGLEVCDRQCLHQKVHKDALGQFPDLEFAMLMPWIDGATWYDILVGKRALSKLDALKTANATSQVLSALEESGLAHCDIAAPNVIVDIYLGRTHLIDVEDLYAPGFTTPSALPAGTEGYAHKSVAKGQWSPTADRFAGAVLLAEMSGWHSPQVRATAEDEHYFDAAEMQVDSPRYRLLLDTLNEVSLDLGNLLEQAWASETLDECPRLQEWYSVINTLFQEEYHREQVAPIVSSWNPILAAADVAQSAPTPVTPAAQAAPAGSPRPITTPATRDKPVPAARPAAPSSRPIKPAAPVGGQIKASPPTSPVVEWRPLGSAMPIQATAVAGPNASIATANTAQAMPATDAATSANGLLKPTLTVRIDPHQRPLVAWSESYGATHYLLQESESDTFGECQEYRIRAAKTYWEPPTWGWRRAKRLYYRVRALKRKEVGPWSNVAIVDLV